MTEARTRIGKITLKDNAVRSMMMNDGLGNLVSGLGGGMDQQSYAFYYQRDLSQQQVEASFRTSWISRKAHVIPATDSVRAGWQHKADNVDITKIEKEERRLGLKEKIRRAELLSRLYGGSCIMMGVGSDNPRLPLDPMRVRLGDLKYLHVLSRYQVTVQDLILDPGSPFYGQPSMYYVNAGNGSLIEVHPSRIIRFVNSDLSEELLWQNQGWGDPLLLSMWSAIVNADTAQGSFAALLNKAQVDTLSVPNFTQSISTQAGEDAWKKRALYTKMYEGLFAVKLIDSGKNGSDAEKWEQFTVNWAGIPDVLMAFLQMVSGATDIPFTRLAGKSPDGQNSTGESDQENYNLVITAGQELSLRPRMEQIFNVLYPSALGTAGGDIWFSFNALKIDSDETKAKNAKARAEASQIYTSTGLVPDEVMQEAVKGQLIESGEYPGIEMAYDEYAKGTLTPIIEAEEEIDDPLIPVDPITGLPTQNRESRLFAANDIAARLVGKGWAMLDASTEALRLTDATPRTAYVSRPIINTDELQAWATEQGLGQLQDNLHVTVYATWDSFDWMKVKGDWNQSDDGNITIASGGVRILEPLGENYTVCLFTSSQLSWRHESIKRSSETEYTHQDYQPHWSLFKKQVDLTGKEPYRGRIALGPEKWEEFNP